MEVIQLIQNVYTEFHLEHAASRSNPLNAGRMKVSGVVPNGQTFQAQPRQLWLVTDSQATILGENAGMPGALEVQDQMADFWLPQRGLFGAGLGVRFPSTACPTGQKASGARTGNSQSS